MCADTLPVRGVRRIRKVLAVYRCKEFDGRVQVHITKRRSVMKGICQTPEEHESVIKAAMSAMPSEGDIGIMAARFKAISEPSRLKILLALSAGELCVEHITKAMDGNQSAVSHQLKTLKDNRIIKSRRVGKNILYSVDDEHIMAMIEAAKEHLHHHE